MAIILLQHGDGLGPGRLGTTLRGLGATLRTIRVDLGEPLPPVQELGEDINGVISLCGQQNVTDNLPWLAAEQAFVRATHERQLPLVGLCLGSQIIAAALGGTVGPMAGPASSEHGMVEVNQHPIANTDIVLAGIPWKTWQFQAHGQEVKDLPPGATLLQSSAACRVQSYRIGLRTYGFQYHFECTLPMIHAFHKITHKSLQGVDEHYDRFATAADRLCENIALYLMPIGRAVAAV